MGNLLEDKTILLISPCQWGTMHISKHHYAIELAKRGNRVYYLSPPRSDLKENIKIKEHESHRGLYLIDYKPLFPFTIRFHLRWLYEQMIKLHINQVLAKINDKIDITWCFEPNLYSDLRLFKTKLNIFHPVDQLLFNYQIEVSQSSDLIIAPSKSILDLFSEGRKPCIFINHGLADCFKKYSLLLWEEDKYKPGKPIKIGYSGNLLSHSLDKRIFRQIIQENSDVVFFLWGSTKAAECNIGGPADEEFLEFMNFLKNQKNVVICGCKMPEVLSGEIQEMDGFLVCIDPERDFNKGCNTHKAIEYMSTGKVVISNHLSSYDERRDLIEMLETNNNRKLPALFKKVIGKLDFYNSAESRKKRIKFALHNSYAMQIERICEFLNNKLKEGNLF